MKKIINQLYKSHKMSDRLLAHSAEIVLDTLDSLEIRDIKISSIINGVITIEAKHKNLKATYTVTENGVSFNA